MAPMMLAGCCSAPGAHWRSMQATRRAVWRGPSLKCRHRRPEMSKDFGREKQVASCAMNEPGELGLAENACMMREPPLRSMRVDLN